MIYNDKRYYSVVNPLLDGSHVCLRQAMRLHPRSFGEEQDDAPNPIFGGGMGTDAAELFSPPRGTRLRGRCKGRYRGGCLRESWKPHGSWAKLGRRVQGSHRIKKQRPTFCRAIKFDGANEGKRQPPPNLPRSSGEERKRTQLSYFLPQEGHACVAAVRGDTEGVVFTGVPYRREEFNDRIRRSIC